MPQRKYCKNGHNLEETREYDNRGMSRCSICTKVSHYKRYHDNIEIERQKRRDYYYNGGKLKLDKLRAENKKKWLSLLTEFNMLHCWRCTYSTCFSAIDFHHMEPKKKEYQIGLFLTQKITTKRVDELKKTIPLCRNCHAELHSGLWSLDEIRDYLNKNMEDEK